MLLSPHYRRMLFKVSAADLLPAGRADAVLEAVWSLDQATDLRPLMSLLRLR